VTRPVWVLTVRPLPTRYGDAPPEVRLRRALKCLLRTFGLRCVRVEDVSADPEAEPSSDDERQPAAK
jgi:hypothetical protein